MLSRVATINSVHPKRYFSRPGYGCIYTYVNSVEIGHERVKITILALDCGEIAKKIDVTITDCELLKLLPSLLGGEISCLQAMQELEIFLRKKHNDSLYP